MGEEARSRVERRHHGHRRKEGFLPRAGAHFHSKHRAPASSQGSGFHRELLLED